jgi:hypothetical protein
MVHTPTVPSRATSAAPLGHNPSAHNPSAHDSYIWLVTADESLEPIGQTSTPQSTEPSYRIGKGGPALGPLSGISQIPAMGGVRPVQVEQAKLERGMTQFLGTMGRVLNRAQAAAPDLGNMVLDEIELAIEISGEGEVRLLGSGGKAGSKGTMTLKFKRSDGTT